MHITNITIEDCTFNNHTIGIEMAGYGAIRIENSTFNIHEKGIEMYYNSLRDIPFEIHNCTFLNSSQYALKVNGNGEGDIRDNYWGHESGPYHRIENPEGLGGNITGNVDFDPWKEKEVRRSGKEGLNEEDRIIIPYIVAGILSISLLGIALHREDLRFLLLSLLTLPLYSRMERSEILDQSTRNDIFTRVVSEPGVNYSAIKSKLGLGTGSLVYHLEVLEREGYIRSKKEMGRKMFFPKSTVVPTDSISSILPPSPLQEKILEYLKENGPKTRREIEEGLALKRQTVVYSIRNLERKGLVKTGGRGRNDRCELVVK